MILDLSEQSMYHAFHALWPSLSRECVSPIVVAQSSSSFLESLMNWFSVFFWAIDGQSYKLEGLCGLGPGPGHVQLFDFKRIRERAFWYDVVKQTRVGSCSCVASLPRTCWNIT